MASLQVKESERKLAAMVCQNDRLEDEVDRMESVLALHHTRTAQQQNSVRGMLRKEIGGSIWENGGEGQLRHNSARNQSRPNSAKKKQSTTSQKKIKSSEEDITKHDFGTTFSVSSVRGVNSTSRSSYTENKINNCNTDNFKTRLKDVKSKKGVHSSRKEECESIIDSQTPQNETDYLRLGHESSKYGAETERETAELLAQIVKTMGDDVTTDCQPVIKNRTNVPKSNRTPKVSSSDNNVEFIAFGEKFAQLSHNYSGHRTDKKDDDKLLQQNVISEGTADNHTSKSKTVLQNKLLSKNKPSNKHATFTIHDDDPTAVSDPKSSNIEIRNKNQRVPSARVTGKTKTSARQKPTQQTPSSKRNSQPSPLFTKCKSVDALVDVDAKASKKSSVRDGRESGEKKTVIERRPRSASSSRQSANTNAGVLRQRPGSAQNLNRQASKEKLLKDLKVDRDILNIKKQTKSMNSQTQTSKAVKNQKVKEPSKGDTSRPLSKRDREEFTKADRSKMLNTRKCDTDIEETKHTSAKQGHDNQTPEDLVKQLEQQVKNLVSNDPVQKESAVGMIDRLQQQLNAIQKELTNQVGHAHSQGAVDAGQEDTGPHEKTECAQYFVNKEEDLTKREGVHFMVSPSNRDDEKISNIIHNESGKRTKSGLNLNKVTSVNRPATSPANKTTKSQTVNMSMRKTELLKEVRKEREVYRKQIRHLESELNRIKHQDPLRSCELLASDIVFNKSDLIGEGAFSKVFKGTFQSSEVAIKQLKIALIEQDRNYFTAEVNMLHELRHPRVVLLLGVCTSLPRPLMVLEYMAQGSLYNYLHDESKVDLDHAAYYQTAEDIALGMNYLHRHRPTVLHLDLKSQNILLGLLGRAKIADFGFSKLRHDADAAAGKMQGVKGTPAWMAPEMLSMGAVTTKADVYSYGIIMWEMLSRTHPYQGCSVFKILEKIKKNQRPKMPSDCPGELSELIQQCWHQNPAVRPSFKDILRSLDGLSFPPDWRALLSSAGVPGQMLDNVQSTRAIIELVTSTLDSADLKQYMQINLPDANEDGDLEEVILTSNDTTMDDSYQEMISFEYNDQKKNNLGTTLKNELQLDLNDDEGKTHSSVDTMTIGEGDFLYDDSSSWESREHTPGMTQEFGDLQKVTHGDDGNTFKFKSGSEAKLKESILSGHICDNSRNSKNNDIPPPPPPPPIENLIKQLESGLGHLNNSGQKTKYLKKEESQNIKGSSHGQKMCPPGHHNIPASALLAQRQKLRPTFQAHPSQLRDLSEVDETSLNSLTAILRKAVEERRILMHEDHSLDQTDSMGWSLTN